MSRPLHSNKKPSLLAKLIALAALALISVYYVDETRESAAEIVAKKSDALKTEAVSQARQGMFVSPAGLLYGPDPNPAFEDRLAHVMAHTRPDLSKPKHSIFVEKSQPGIIALLDEAWQQRGPPDQQGGARGRDVYNVWMDRVVGTEGQHMIRLITERDSARVVTAYPVEVK